jgi:hypothetical protein
MAMLLYSGIEPGVTCCSECSLIQKETNTARLTLGRNHLTIQIHLVKPGYEDFATDFGYRFRHSLILVISTISLVFCN